MASWREVIGGALHLDNYERPTTEPMSFRSVKRKRHERK
jgi:hypothetical protein